MKGRKSPTNDFERTRTRVLALTERDSYGEGASQCFSVLGGGGGEGHRSASVSIAQWKGGTKSTSDYIVDRWGVGAGGHK